MENRNLREMLADAKDTSELMVDLAYASVFFDDVDMADEVTELEAQINDLVFRMRSLAILAVRNPKEAEAMAAVLQVISSVESIGNSAVSISRVVTRRLGIPRQLVMDLMAAEEISHRVVVSTDSIVANSALSQFELPVQTGMRVIALRRDRQWIVDPDGDEIIKPNDVLFLRGPAAGVDKLREIVGAPKWNPPSIVDDDGPLTDLDRAVDTVIEMKDLSEVAVGLAYSALVFKDRSLAAEVLHLEDRLDEMKERLELWVLRCAQDDVEATKLRGLLHLGEAAEDLGNQAKQMVWLVERAEELHEVLEMALGDTDDVVVLMPIAENSEVAGQKLGEIELSTESGFHLLALERSGKYVYRPQANAMLNPGDRVLAYGPEEGQGALASLFGWKLVSEDDGELAFEPL